MVSFTSWCKVKNKKDHKKKKNYDGLLKSFALLNILIWCDSWLAKRNEYRMEFVAICNALTKYDQKNQQTFIINLLKWDERF